MKRYIDENQMRNPKHNKTKWWTNFPTQLCDFLFLFVSGKFTGNFKKQLQVLSEKTNNTLGSAISSYALLRTADQIADNRMTHQAFREKISCLGEISEQQGG